ncbi:MAG: histidine kinase dimerization/phospho-acceptor domain-containing protein, partial [Cyanobacteria bacterium P01_H01_bin.121]
MSESNANPLPLASSLSRDLDVLNPLLWLEFAEFQAGFLARSAHELRSPISSLMSCQQLILNDLCDSPEEERSCLQTAYEATQRLLTMLDTLVTISKLKIGKIQPKRQRIPLQDLLDEIYAMTHLAIANQNTKLEIEALPDPALTVEGDPFVLRQLFPIIVNAILPDLSAGTVRLKLSLETSQAPNQQRTEQQRVKLQIQGQQPFQTLQAALQDNSGS